MRKRHVTTTDAMGPGLDLIVSLFAIVAALYALAAHRNIEQQHDLNSERTTRQSEARQSAEALEEAASAREKLALQNVNLKDRVEALHEDKQRVSTELLTATARVDQLDKDLKFVRKQEGEFRKQLVGLTGGLENVVVVVDRSSSMQRDNRWVRTQATVQRWLTYLPVKKAAIIVYSNELKRFPSSGYANFETGGDERRQTLVNQFLEIEPDGGTSTKAALTAAVAYPDVDTIILFTDGQPTDGSTDEIVKAIGKLYRQRSKKFHVNTIAVGVYFDKKSVEFLENLAEVSSGSYRAE